MDMGKTGDIKDMEINGDSLVGSNREALISNIKSRYLMLKILGIFIIAGVLYNGLFMMKGFIFDGDFRDGFFQILSVRMTVMAISLLFVAALIYGGFKLFSTAVKIEKAVEQGRFFWTIGQLTDKKRFKRKNRTVYTFYVDEICCTPLGLKNEEINNASLGDIFLMVRFDNKVAFALKPKEIK